MDTFLLQLTDTFSLGNLIINFHFRNRKSITFFVTITLLLFDSGICLPFNNGNALNLKNHKPNRERSKLSVSKFKYFFLIKRINKINQQDVKKSTLRSLLMKKITSQTAKDQN